MLRFNLCFEAAEKHAGEPNGGWSKLISRVVETSTPLTLTRQAAVQGATIGLCIFLLYAEAYS